MEKCIIDESLAKRNKENMSFSDYKVGSATAEYNEVIKEATEKVENAKLRVSQEAQVKLDSLLERYKFKYASWINRHNANGSKHVSVMIAGPSNYNMKAHDRWMERESKLWKEYDEIKDIDYQISKIVHGDKIIKSSDENAIEKLKEKLAKEQGLHKKNIEYNKKARKEGIATLPPYVLQNSNARMKSMKDRIARLERLAAQETKEISIDKENEEIEVNGVKIIDNVEANRLQIIFDGKPDAKIRESLKKHGFRWSPSNMAWQRFRSAEAIRIAKDIVSTMM